MTSIKAGLVIPRDPRGAAGLVANVQQAEARGVKQVWTTVGGASPDPVTADQEMTDELVDELAVSGSPEEIRQRLQHLHDLGIDEVLVSHVAVHDADEELAHLSSILAG